MGYSPSQLIDKSDMSAGISNINITRNGTWLICQFDRKMQYPTFNNQFFTLNNSFYLQGAFGNLDSSGML
jgi:hypothetical protein